MSSAILILDPWLELARAFARRLRDAHHDYLIVSASEKVCASIGEIDDRNFVCEAEIRTELGLRNGFAACVEKFGGLAHVIRVIRLQPLSDTPSEIISKFNNKTLENLNLCAALSIDKIKTSTINKQKNGNGTQKDAEMGDVQTTLIEDRDSLDSSLLPLQLRGSLSFLLAPRVNPESPFEPDVEILRENVAALVRHNVRVFGESLISLNAFSVDRVHDDDLLLKAIKARYPMSRPADPEQIAATLIQFTQSHLGFISGQYLSLNGGG